MADDFDISLRSGGEESVRLRRTAGRSGFTAAMLAGEDRVAIPIGGLIGRDSDCDLRLISGLVAPRHAHIDLEPGGARITDLGTSTGVYVNGDHFMNASRPLRGGDSIAIGDEVLYFVTSADAPLPPSGSTHAALPATDGPGAVAAGT